LREQVVRNQSQDEHGIYIGSGLLENNNPMSNLELLISVDNGRIAAIHGEQACTICQLICPRGSKLHLYSHENISHGVWLELEL
jgi:hypothetical protein